MPDWINNLLWMAVGAFGMAVVILILFVIFEIGKGDEDE